MPDYQRLTELLNCSMRVHQGSSTIAEWLECFTRLTNCDSAASLRWTCGKPRYCIESSYGDIPNFSADLRAAFDQIIGHSTYRQPGLLEDFLTGELTVTCELKTLLNNPQYLVTALDWNPACIVLVMRRHQGQPEWTEADRQRVRAILPYVRDSVQVHKILDRHRYIAGLARDLLNKSPRGILMLSEDCSIQLANTRAKAILAENDGLSESNGKLVIHSKAVAERVKNYLLEMENMDNRGMPEMDWNMVATKPSGGQPYQIILGYMKLADWNIESRHSDRVAVMHLHDPHTTAGIAPEQLSAFYGFTKAQARLAAKLFQGQTIFQAAEALHVSVNTARTHIRGIYSKTGVSSQAELLGLLSAGLTSYGENIEGD